MKTDIIPYTSEHRARVREICCDTAFAGESIGPFFEDLELFADLNTLYYTDGEPGSAFTATADGAVVGYLLGCTDTERFLRATAATYAPRVLMRLLMSRYRIGPAARRYIVRALRQALQGGFGEFPTRRYPAHLHINLVRSARGLGLGRRLMETYLAFLKQRGIPGVWLGTTSLNVEAVPLYEKMGFRLYDKRRVRDHFWSDVMSRDVYNLVYAKRLSP